MSTEAVWLLGSGMRGHESDAVLVTVFEREKAALLRMAWLVCGDAAAAEDAVAEAVARALPRWRSDGVESPAAYLRTAVVRELLARGRRTTVARRFAHRVVEPTNLRDEVRHVDDRAWLAPALDALPPRQRAVVVLRYYLDLSEAEIASALGVRAGTVKSQSAKALANLRAALADQEEVR